MRGFEESGSDTDATVARSKGGAGQHASAPSFHAGKRFVDCFLVFAARLPAMTAATATNDSPAVAHDVGVGRVLQSVRQPTVQDRPHVVEFRHVTKTYNVGLANEFTAI